MAEGLTEDRLPIPSTLKPIRNRGADRQMGFSRVRDMNEAEQQLLWEDLIRPLPQADDSQLPLCPKDEHAR